MIHCDKFFRRLIVDIIFLNRVYAGGSQFGSNYLQEVTQDLSGKD